MKYKIYKQLTPEQKEEYDCYNTSSFRTLILLFTTDVALISSIVGFVFFAHINKLIFILLFICIILSFAVVIFLDIAVFNILIKMRKFKKRLKIKNTFSIHNFEV